jgi:hypothetical protein
MELPNYIEVEIELPSVDVNVSMINIEKEIVLEETMIAVS